MPCRQLALAVLFAVAYGPLASQGQDAEPPAAAAHRVDAIGDPLPPNARLRLGSRRFRHPSGVAEIALSPDEQTVVAIGHHGGLLIAWDTATGQERWRQKQNDLNLWAASYGTRAIAFAPDGQLFYTPMPQSRQPGKPLATGVLAWDARTGEMRPIPLGGGLPPALAGLIGMQTGPYRSIDVAPNGGRLAVGNESGLTVCSDGGDVVYKVPNAPKQPIEIGGNNRDRLLFGGDYSYARFSPDGKQLAVVLSEAPEEIRLSNADDGKEVRRITLEDRLVRMDFAPDGASIVATERDSSVRRYDVTTGEQLWSHTVKLTNPNENYTSAIAVAPDGKTVVVGATDDCLHILDAATGDEQAVLAGAGWYPWAVAFARDSNLLYSSGWGGVIRRWDLAKREQLPLPAGVRATGVVGMSPDGRRLAYEDDSGAVRLVDAADGRELRQFRVPQAQYSQLVFSPNSQQLAGGGTLGDQVHVAVWDLASGNVVHRWEWPLGADPKSDIEALAFTPDGQRLAAASFRQDMAYLWDLDASKKLAEMRHPEIYGLSFSPDGKTLATVGWDSRLKLWSAANGESQADIEVKKHMGDVPTPQGAIDMFVGEDADLRMYGASYAPLGGLLATQHMTGELWLWDAASQKVKQRLAGRESFGYGSVAFSPSGLYIAAGTSGGSVLVWDALTGELVWRSDPHEDTVYVLSFGASSHTLASGGDDGMCYLWDIQRPGEPVRSQQGRLVGDNLPKSRISHDSAMLWDFLTGNDSEAAYFALRLFAEIPDKTVPLFGEKLRSVTSFIDLDAVEEGAAPVDVEHTRRLKQQLIEKDPSIESALTARRAIGLLFELRTPAARKLLEELAANPNSDLGRMAAEAVKAITRIY
jgi:WD40 repeat protein